MITGDVNYWLALAMEKITEWGWMPFIWVPIIIAAAGWILTTAVRAARGD